MNPPDAHRSDFAGFVIAALLLFLAGVVAFDAARLQAAPAYGVGPTAMPYVIATGLAVLAAGNFVLAWRGEFPAREAYNPRSVILILGGFAALIAIIGVGGGFIVATAVLFASTAAAFGRRAMLTDLVIGLILGTAAFLMFDKVLTLALPAGPLERLF